MKPRAKYAYLCRDCGKTYQFPAAYRAHCESCPRKPVKLPKG